MSDYLKHLLVNLGIALFGAVNLPFAIGASLGASFGKEYGDSKAPGNRWDWKDILYDIIGLAIGVSIVLLYRLMTGRGNLMDL